jgi:hypothetical protein
MDWSLSWIIEGTNVAEKKVQWLDLASLLWPPLVGLPLAKVVQVHYDFIVKYSKLRLSSSLKNYYWFFQYMGSDNGDVCNVLPSLGIKYSKSFYFIISFYSYFVNDAPPTSLMDSLQVQRWRQRKEKELGCVP